MTAPALPNEVLLVAPPLDYSMPTLYALTLATGLRARGRRIGVLSAGGRFEKLFRDRGIDLFIEPRIEQPIAEWFTLRRLARDLGGTGSGVRAVHAVSSLKTATASALARRLGAPAIATIHRLWNPKTPIETDWSGVSAIITLSDNLRADAVNNRRAPRDLVRVIPAGVSAPLAPDPPFGREGAVPIVGTLGDVEKVEAQVDFVLAAAEVLARVPKLEFLVVSGGAEPKALRQLGREIGVASAMTFTTYIETAKALSLMDVCVLPGAQEGPGQTILEAMAAGRPVITTGAGGAYGVIKDEVTGLIVEKGDRSKLAAAILRLVEDRDLARRIGAAAREIVLERFPLDRMLDDTLATYDAALAAAR